MTHSQALPVAATYRLQFRGRMDFDGAAALAPYLKRLGISHVYASPVFAAAAGSTHGYDVIDHNAIEPALGGREGFDRMSDAFQAEGLGLILDIVPNHMAAHEANPWWADVLEWGRQGAHGDHFDIDWTAERLLLPILGKPYLEALEAGELQVARTETGLALAYYGRRFPLIPTSYGVVLAAGGDEALAGLARAFAAATPAGAEELKAELAGADPARVEAALAAINADHDALHRLHEAQIWRLGHWRLARESLTYRRFFEITELAGVKVERPEVFEDVHRLILELVREGRVQGLRIDHIDGLADPAGYLRRLRDAAGEGVPVWVEKILHEGETLPEGWETRGTTGYEFIAAVAKAMTDPAAEASFTEAYESFTGEAHDYAALVEDAKRRILARNLAAELDALTDQARGVAKRRLETRDLGRDTLRRAIIETARAVPVYRSYVSVEGASARDRAMIDACAEAAKATREVENEIGVDFVRQLMLLDFEDPELQAAALAFAQRFQQVTGPVTAKALEDTVFYRYNRLIGLNEVGGAPDLFGASLAAAHEALAAAPRGRLNATATHDTKRGEDARARLYALSLAPERWIEAVNRWGDRNAHLWRDAEPDRDFEWMFYQALYGAWPTGLARENDSGVESLKERTLAFVEKAAKEAKARTSWTLPDEPYERAILGFAEDALHPRRSAAFLDDFRETCEPFWRAGDILGLGQLAIKLAAPGAPDIYQGCERRDLSYVDPDNRRPVDYAVVRRALDDVAEGRTGCEEADCRAKLRLIAAGLALRAEAPALFAKGDYLPLEAAPAGGVFAFARKEGEAACLVVAPVRALAAALSGLGGEAPERIELVLPKGLGGRSWRDVSSGERFESGPDRLALPVSGCARVLAG